VVSIIIPVYNLEKYIRYCIESALRSDYSDIEIIIVDDGSIDNSGMICDEYAERYENVHVTHSDNKGVSAARNIGIDVSKGEYIFFLDGDDVIYPETISTLMNVITKKIVYSSCGFSKITNYGEYTSTNSFEDNHRRSGEWIQRSVEEELINLLTWKGRVGVWGIIFHREKIGDLRFVEGKVDNEDKFFRFQYLMRNEGTVGETKSPLYGHYSRKGSLSNSKSYSGQVYSSLVYFAEQIRKETEGQELESVGKYNEMVTYLHVLKYIIRKRAYKEHYIEYNEIRSKLTSYKMMNRDFFRNHYIEYRMALLSDLAFKLSVFMHDLVINRLTIKESQ